jgi:hypothetical protein
MLGIRGSIARYASSGHIIHSAGGVLLAVPFDAERLEITGAPVPVQDKVAGTASSGAVFFDVSDDGNLTYVPGTPRAALSELAWLDRQGNIEPLPIPPGQYQYIDLSPNDRYLAMSIGPGRGRGDDVWIYDIERDTMTRLTFTGSSFGARWTPDGVRVAYTAASGAEEGIAMQPADGSAPPERIASGPAPMVPDSFSPDGRLLLISEIGGIGNGDVQLLDLDNRDEGVRPLLGTDFVEMGSTISPDGQWFAYSSNESGNAEVYVQPFPGRGGKWQVSTDGGQAPLWSPRGDEIFYRKEDNLMVSPVRLKPTFSAGKPRVLFEAGALVSLLAPLPNYDVTSDGERIVVMTGVSGPTEADKISIVLNWFADLRRLAPIGGD